MMTTVLSSFCFVAVKSTSVIQAGQSGCSAGSMRRMKLEYPEKIMMSIRYPTSTKICEFKDLDDDLSVGTARKPDDHLPEVNRKSHNDAQADNEAEQHRQDQPAAESDHRFDTALPSFSYTRCNFSQLNGGRFIAFTSGTQNQRNVHRTTLLPM